MKTQMKLSLPMYATCYTLASQGIYLYICIYFISNNSLSCPTYFAVVVIIKFFKDMFLFLRVIHVHILRIVYFIDKETNAVWMLTEKLNYANIICVQDRVLVTLHIIYEYVYSTPIILLYETKDITYIVVDCCCRYCLLFLMLAI